MCVYVCLSVTRGKTRKIAYFKSGKISQKKKKELKRNFLAAGEVRTLQFRRRQRGRAKMQTNWIKGLESDWHMRPVAHFLAKTKCKSLRKSGGGQIELGWTNWRCLLLGIWHLEANAQSFFRFHLPAAHKLHFFILKLFLCAFCPSYGISMDCKKVLFICRNIFPPRKVWLNRLSRICHDLHW